MTIDWKALEQHFLMVPFVPQMHFLSFSKKNSVLKELNGILNLGLLFE
jgi:hypothetical protein